MVGALLSSVDAVLGSDEPRLASPVDDALAVDVSAGDSMETTGVSVPSEESAVGDVLFSLPQPTSQKLVRHANAKVDKDRFTANLRVAVIVGNGKNRLKFVVNSWDGSQAPTMGREFRNKRRRRQEQCGTGCAGYDNCARNLPLQPRQAKCIGRICVAISLWQV